MIRSRPKKSIFGNTSGISILTLFLFAIFASLLPVNYSASGSGKHPQLSSASSKQRQKKRGHSPESFTPYTKRSGDGTDLLRPLLAFADFDLLGLSVTASPATQTVPKNTSTAILIEIQTPPGTDRQEAIAGLNANLRVRGELVGPSLNSPLSIETHIGQQLVIPPLSRAGDHILQNLRVVDTGQPDSPSVATVTPDLCAIEVIDQILVSEVRVEELSYEEIIQSGISITDDSYSFFNFLLALTTSSTTININLPVAFPDVESEDPRPVIGRPDRPVQPGIDIPTVDAVPVMLEIEEEESSGVKFNFEGHPVRIPGVVVFPGRVGFLNQFFEAIVIVSNGAPMGAPLVIRNLRANVKLPDNDTPADAADDPLRIAATQTGGAVTELEVRGLGSDGKYGTGDDLTRLAPSQTGQATFLLEGLKEGLHSLSFELEGTLEGLPSGSVTVRGEVPGSVLVRDASFATTFSHPSIVRAGNEYELSMTIYNSGNRDINGAIARLSPSRISGASLIEADTGVRAFDTTISRKSSSTVSWRLRATTTGAITASYVKVGEGIESGLMLVTGVGDRDVPLSPESLILPDEVKFLPTSVVEAGRELLGQTWSVASAPRGSLPTDVMAIAKGVVIDRALEMGMAGLRVEFGERVEDSVMTLMRDWLGELQSTPDKGFADALVSTHSGMNFCDAIGSYFNSRMKTEEPLISSHELHSRLAEIESPRSPFISAMINQTEGTESFGARLIDPSGRKTGFLSSQSQRASELSTAAVLRLATRDGSASLGQMLVASRPVDGNWFVEISAWRNATVDISIMVPGQGNSYRQALFAGVQIVQGNEYRIRVRPGSTSAFVLEELSGGSYRPTAFVAVVNSIAEPAARLVGALQVSAEVMTGGDKYGRLVGLLFSKPMHRSSSETASRYKIGGGELSGSQPPSIIGKAINVRTATLQPGGRFVFLGLDAPIGPYIRRDVTISGISDSRGTPISSSSLNSEISTTVSREGNPPGAILTGRVVLADGSPVMNASVIYWTQSCGSGEQPAAITIQKTDSTGRYAIDYVRNGDCGGVVITATNPANGSLKRLSTPVVFDGQHLVLDLVFLARGSVRGRVMTGSVPAPFALVKVIPHLDTSITATVLTDSLGRYSIDDIPVGHLTVSATGSGTLSTATGIASGTIEGPGHSETVDVLLQSLSGTVRGRVINTDLTHSVGSLVIAKANLTGFSSNDPRGVPVGFAFTGRDGTFAITRLPLAEINLEVRDYVTGLSVHHTVPLSQSTTVINDIVITLPGFGSISGKVTDENGVFIPFARVRSGGCEVRTDALGNYELTGLRAGTYTITATETASGASGELDVSVATNQITNNVNIIITRPGSIIGQVFVLAASGQSVPVVNATITHDGQTLTTSDSQGRYSLSNIRANTPITLRFIHPNNRMAVNINTFVTPGEVVVRNATFKSANLRGRIVQPDGSTGTVAELTAFVLLPSLDSGSGFGLLEIKEISTHSAADGSYSIGLLNPGAYRLRASSAFFPVKVSKGGTLTQAEDEVCNITLVSTLAGKIHGHVLLPDGVTPAGVNVTVTLGGAIANVTVKTEPGGNFEFPEVFAEGSYTITATDTASGLTNRISISVRQNEDTVAAIRLLGRGSLRVRVIDGAGNPPTVGSISVDGSAHPRIHRFDQLTLHSGGVVEFNDLSEGDYAVTATQNGLSGRASVTISDGFTVETTIQLQASGIVEGRVLMPDSVTGVELADVFLSVNNRRVGVSITSGEEDQTGRFIFPQVPVGNFTLEAFDNRTGRTGRAAGAISAQGQISQVDIRLVAVGAVTGTVRQNGQPVDHALVKITASGGTRLQATTTFDGHYRFTAIPVGPVSISVTEGSGGLSGHATGQVAGTVEPLSDTVIDVTLQPSLSVTGAVFRSGGVEPVAGAKVKLRAGSRVIETTSNQNGEYRIEFAPPGELRMSAEAAAGFDRGEAPAIVATQSGSTQVINITLAGTGDIVGFALDQNGVPLDSGTVTYTNVEFDSEVVLVGQVQPDGRYQINGAPAGEFSLRLTVPGRAGAGVASGTISANQRIELPVMLEGAGTVKGTVRRPDGTTAAASADVILTVARSEMAIRLLGHTNSQGIFNFENVPLGTLSINITDPQTESIARVSGLSLNENGQVVDAGTLILDNSAIRIESISPANGETGVAVNSDITLRFSEPAEPNSINENSVKFLKGSALVACDLALSNDGLRATLSPLNLLEDFSNYTVIVTTAVRDLAGIAIAEEFRSSFTTTDANAPIVTGLHPAGNSVGVGIDSPIMVTFNESLDATQNLNAVVNLFAEPDMSASIAGAISIDISGEILTFRPTALLSENTEYTIRVTGQRDRFGNVQEAIFTSRFTTIDHTPPLITAVTPASGNQHGGTTVTLTGAGLLNTNGTPPLILIGGGHAIVTSVTAGNPGTVVVVTPAGTPGPATVTVSTDNGSASFPDRFTYELDPRTPFVAEPDTRLLWHLDEAGDGQLQIVDSGPMSIDGQSSSSSKSSAGRFAGGRSRLLARMDSDFGSLGFGSSSFTVECWIKTGQVSLRTILVGKTSGSGSSEEFSLELQPSGALTGKVINSSNSVWQANMDAAAFDIDNDIWHSVAMVVDREFGKLKLYVDGQERATRDEPAGFGAVRNLNLPVFAGFTPTSFFNGIMDEVRISSSAHSAEKVRDDYFGIDGPLVVRVSPPVIQQGDSEAAIDLSGKGLAGVSVSSNHPDVTAIVRRSSATALSLKVAVGETTPLGSTQFTITDSNGRSATFELMIVDQRPFENSPDGDETRLLWHLDEPGNGAVSIIGSGDAVPSIIGGTAGSNSQAAQGRFGGGRSGARAEASASTPFAFGQSSFTFEFWMKTGPLPRSYALAGKENLNGQNSDFTVVTNEIGGLRAAVSNASAISWFAEISGTELSLFDNQWHSVSVVVERNTDPATDRLKIYVDGELRVSTAPPDSFGPIRNSGNTFQIGSVNADSAGIGPTAFPGIIDEVRILNFSRTAEQIRATWFGTNNFSGFNLLIPSRKFPSTFLQKTDPASSKGGWR